MRRFSRVVALAGVMLFCSFSFGGEKAANSTSVYICTGAHATKYHKKSNCTGLNRCGGTIKQVSIETAKKQGRKPCKKCYR